MAINNMSYDVLSTLQSKLEALDVYEQYIEDCQEAGDEKCRQVFEQIRRDDERHAQMLRDEVERLVREGKFR